ncbi:Lipid A 3-O-deacylase (PagL) [Nitrosomonas communis]|uniref:Lipid A 3-O-deacylase (PagL) n=2 Tax=Nitrosomonas communis TaxID=44574 RepID=A0A1I4KG62_9PROT|nr:Lipid A 3-O-deacylase (PagL) [Nitrosomonas communis]
MRNIRLIMRTQIIGGLVFSLACIVSSAGFAEEQKTLAWLHEVKFGILHHDTGGLWSGFNRESGVDFNLEAIFSPHVKFLGGSFRPAFGGSANTAGDTSKLYTDIRWQYEHTSGIFFGIGIGGAVHNGKLHLEQDDRKALGSRVLFHIPIEIGYRLGAKTSLSVYFDHVSNAFLADKNEGMDTLGGRFGFRF